jgi:lipopolysaccharide transport system ATP-binding protein
MAKEKLIEVSGVSKKFSKNLKRSLWYGFTDICKELVGMSEYKRLDLRKTEFWAVKDVSFELHRGECLGLIGRNGAGKTTLLKMMNGLVKPDQGSISMRGKVGALIALGTGFDPILTGRENIYVNASILGIKKRNIDNLVEEIIEFSELGDFIETPVRSYSSGMVSRLGFSIAVHLKPDILILDEVLAVGDAGFKMKSMNKMHEIMHDTAVIFVNHNMATLSRVCNKVMYLKDGHVEYLGDNVLQGIEMYLSQFEDERSFIENNEYAQFHDVAIRTHVDRGFDPKGRPIINHGEDLIFDFNYYLDPQFDWHVLAFVVSNKDFITILVHKSEPILNSKDGNMRVTIKIPQIELSNGDYSVTIKIASAFKDGRAPINFATYRHWKRFKIAGLDSLNSVLLQIFGEVTDVNGNPPVKIAEIVHTDK